ncbi:MAG: penicillin-binding protein 2 [Candidatus Thioglobus autotrophicus]|nr:penicillin-binding protein 2 [Candidatus Thioglobus autotrophicus]
MKLTRVQNYWNRQALVKYCFIAIIVVFVYQAINIHSKQVNGTSLKDKASARAEQTITENAIRGNILDRNGNILAIDLIQNKINLDPMIIQDEYIPLLAEALLIPIKELRRIIEEKRNNQRKEYIVKENLMVTDPILKNISELKKRRIEVCNTQLITPSINLFEKAKLLAGIDVSLKEKVERVKCGKQFVSGVAIQSSGFRYYPKTKSTAPLLGRTNNNNIGVFGIEAEFDRYLAGTNGEKIIKDNKSNSNIYHQTEIVQELKNGEDIKLTIDADIQFHVYNAIKESAEFHEADSASAIVLSPNGEILALANYPSANPNDRKSFDAEEYRNRVLADKIEPGSTMKPFTMLLALDKGVITATEDELIDVTERIGNHRPDEKYTEITVKLILEKSHNLGTINISERLENEDFYNAWKKLGFGESLGLMPSIENPGILRHFSTWGLTDKRSVSFGHGPMNTNLAQLARAYLVFANDGALPALKLIKDGNIDTKKQQVFSPESTKRIAEILDSVVSMKGSGYRAIIDGYDVAGKTGTAEMVIDGKYSKEGQKRTYFVGFSPVINPKYIIAVRLDYPKKCFVYWDPTLRNRCEGSNSAAMAFKVAMERILFNDLEIQSVSES